MFFSSRSSSFREKRLLHVLASPDANPNDIRAQIENNVLPEQEIQTRRQLEGIDDLLDAASARVDQATQDAEAQRTAIRTAITSAANALLQDGVEADRVRAIFEDVATLTIGGTPPTVSAVAFANDIEVNGERAPELGSLDGLTPEQQTRLRRLYILLPNPMQNAVVRMVTRLTPEQRVQISPVIERVLSLSDRTNVMSEVARLEPARLQELAAMADPAAVATALEATIANEDLRGHVAAFIHGLTADQQAVVLALRNTSGVATGPSGNALSPEQVEQAVERAREILGRYNPDQFNGNEARIAQHQRQILMQIEAMTFSGAQIDLSNLHAILGVDATHIYGQRGGNPDAIHVLVQEGEGNMAGINMLVRKMMSIVNFLGNAFIPATAEDVIKYGSEAGGGSPDAPETSETLHANEREMRRLFNESPLVYRIERRELDGEQRNVYIFDANLGRGANVWGSTEFYVNEAGVSMCRSTGEYSNTWISVNSREHIRELPGGSLDLHLTQEQLNLGRNVVFTPDQQAIIDSFPTTTEDQLRNRLEINRLARALSGASATAEEAQNNADREYMVQKVNAFQNPIARITVPSGAPPETLVFTVGRYETDFFRHKVNEVSFPFTDAAEFRFAATRENLDRLAELKTSLSEKIRETPERHNARYLIAFINSVREAANPNTAYLMPLNINPLDGRPFSYYSNLLHEMLRVNGPYAMNISDGRLYEDHEGGWDQRLMENFSADISMSSGSRCRDAIRNFANREHMAAGGDDESNFNESTRSEIRAAQSNMQTYIAKIDRMYEVQS